MHEQAGEKLRRLKLGEETAVRHRHHLQAFGEAGAVFEGVEGNDGVVFSAECDDGEGKAALHLLAVAETIGAEAGAAQPT